ncbi:MAG TPA: hypothetical protein VN634_00265 [Candidatus Limnocylindrales bacterium]|nr:hypothetical protein [Candidatus Limnocylindrales bacterium]
MPEPVTFYAPLAGHLATWSSVTVDVTSDDGDASVPLPCDPVDLYVLADPETSIDSAALLREPVIADPPYWAIVWTGARALAATIASSPDIAGTRTLDLGCGLGLSGLVAARSGAFVTFGDYLDEPLAFVRATLTRSQQKESVVAKIDFTRADDDGSRYDVILAADIVYDPAHYRPLADYLDLHLSPAGRIFLTESLRADASVFLAGMIERGFSDEKRALRVIEDGRRERTWLHELARS